MYSALFPHLLSNPVERARVLAIYWPDVPVEHHEDMAAEIDADDVWGFVSQLSERITGQALSDEQVDWIVSELIFDVRDNSHMIRRQVYLLLHAPHRPWLKAYETPVVEEIATVEGLAEAAAAAEEAADAVDADITP